MTDYNALRCPSSFRLITCGAPIASLSLLLGAVAGCGSDPGGLFSAPGNVALGSAVAGNASGGSDASSAGAGSGGTASGSGGAPAIGGSGSGGAPSAGESSGGTASAGAAGADATNSAGSGGMAGASNPNPSACDGQTVKPDALIANFEAGVAGWSAYLDNGPFGVESTQPGASSEHALRFVGGKAKTSGFYHLLPCRDVSAFEGLQFRAKGKGGDAVRFLAVIPGTDPNPDVGDCREPAMKCSDHPGKLFTLSAEWALYRASWAELKQYGWGTKASFYSVINAVLWINDGPVDNFDFSIDDVSLYKHAPP